MSRCVWQEENRSPLRGARDSLEIRVHEGSPLEIRLHFCHEVAKIEVRLGRALAGGAHPRRI